MNSRIGLLALVIGMTGFEIAAVAASSSRAIPPEVLRRTEFYRNADSQWLMEVTSDLVVYSEGDATSSRYEYRTAKAGERFKVLAWNNNMARVKFENGEVGFVRRRVIDPENLGPRNWSERIVQVTPPVARTAVSAPQRPTVANDQRPEIPRVTTEITSMTPATNTVPGLVVVDSLKDKPSTAASGIFSWFSPPADEAKAETPKLEARKEEKKESAAVQTAQQTTPDQPETRHNPTLGLDPLTTGHHVVPTSTAPANHTEPTAVVPEGKPENKKDNKPEVATTASPAPKKETAAAGNQTTLPRETDFPVIADPATEVPKDDKAAAATPTTVTPNTVTPNLVTTSPLRPQTNLPPLLNQSLASLASAPPSTTAITPSLSGRRLDRPNRVTANLEPPPTEPPAARDNIRADAPRLEPTGRPSGTAVDLLQAMSCQAVEDRRFQCYKKNSHQLVGRYANRAGGRISLSGSKPVGRSLSWCYKYVKMSNVGPSGVNCGFFQDNGQALARQAVSVMPSNGFVNVYRVSDMRNVLQAAGITEINEKILSEMAKHVSSSGVRARGAGRDYRPIGSIQVYSNGKRPGHIETKTTQATYTSDYASVNPIDLKSGNYPLLGTFVKKTIFIEAYKKYANGLMSQEVGSCRTLLAQSANSNFMGSQGGQTQARYSGSRQRRQGGRN